MATESVPGPMPRTETLDGPITPAQLMLRYLALEGATIVFGLPGAAIGPLLSELRVRDEFTYVVARQETGAAYMADGFARVSGALGVVLVTSGPGATNALTGAMNAQASGVPVLTISGEVREAVFGLGYLQEGIDAVLDVNAVYRAAVGYTTFIDNPANFHALFETALREALTAPAGAVHVGIPADVQGLPVPAPVTFPRATSNYRTVPRGHDPAASKQALEVLLAAERPLIFLGNGARRALQSAARAAEFAAFVERFSIPVMTTPEAKGIFPETHPLSLRNYGLAGCQWTSAYLLPPAAPNAPRYDALLVIGSALGELAATRTIMPPGQPPPPGVGYWSAALVPDGPLMQVDLDHAAIGRAFSVDLGIVADAAAVLDDLLAAAAGRPVPDSQPGRLAYIEQVRSTPSAPAFGAPSTPNTVQPAAMITALSDKLPAGSHVFVDCGNCVGWCNAYLTVDPPTQVHEALSMGPMGFAVAAVIGAKLAAPDAACVAVVGDGAFLMQGSEISTAAQQGAGAIWIVLDDGDLTMVSQGQEEFFKGPDWNDYYKIGTNDLVGYSTALGAQAVEITSIDDFAPALATALTQSQAGKPQVISVKVDPAAEPPYYYQTS